LRIVVCSKACGEDRKVEKHSEDEEEKVITEEAHTGII
jgi:hypothetical protein